MGQNLRFPLHTSTRLTTFSCFNSCRTRISRNAVIGNCQGRTGNPSKTTQEYPLTPSFSFSIRTFFKATVLLVTRSLALCTSLERGIGTRAFLHYQDTMPTSPKCSLPNLGQFLVLGDLWAVGKGQLPLGGTTGPACRRAHLSPRWLFSLCTTDHAHRSAHTLI